jgi:DNA-binding response OmpR family regulator
MLQQDRTMKQQTPGRVLVAEDDHEMRRLLKQALQRDGYEVIEANNGAELLKDLGARGFANIGADLLVSDIRMPGATGMDVLRALRKHGCNVPVVLISGFCEESQAREARDLGATAIFHKPFEVDDLRIAVHFFLRPSVQPRTTYGS